MANTTITERREYARAKQDALIQRYDDIIASDQVSYREAERIINQGGVKNIEEFMAQISEFLPQGNQEEAKKIGRRIMHLNTYLQKSKAREDILAQRAAVEEAMDDLKNQYEFLNQPRAELNRKLARGEKVSKEEQVMAPEYLAQIGDMQDRIMFMKQYLHQTESEEYAAQTEKETQTQAPVSDKTREGIFNKIRNQIHQGIPTFKKAYSNLADYVSGALAYAKNARASTPKAKARAEAKGYLRFFNGMHENLRQDYLKIEDERESVISHLKELKAEYKVLEKANKELRDSVHPGKNWDDAAQKQFLEKRHEYLTQMKALDERMAPMKGYLAAQQPLLIEIRDLRARMKNLNAYLRETEPKSISEAAKNSFGKAKTICSQSYQKLKANAETARQVWNETSEAMKKEAETRETAERTWETRQEQLKTGEKDLEARLALLNSLGIKPEELNGRVIGFEDGVMRYEYWVGKEKRGLLIDTIDNIVKEYKIVPREATA